MQTEREYLASKGLAILGARGRFSLPAKQELARAKAAGMTFADTPAQAAAKERAAKPRKSTVEVKSVKPAKEPKVADKPTPEGQNFTHFILPSGMFNFYVGDKQVSEAEACRNCGVSLVVCHCEVPEIVWIGNRGDGAKVRRVAARNV